MDYWDNEQSINSFLVITQTERSGAQLRRKSLRKASARRVCKTKVFELPRWQEMVLNQQKIGSYFSRHPGTKAFLLLPDCRVRGKWRLLSQKRLWGNARLRSISLERWTIPTFNKHFYFESQILQLWTIETCLS